jgi:hypothetical protein
LDFVARIDVNVHRLSSHDTRVVGAELVSADRQLLVRRQEELCLISDIAYGHMHIEEFALRGGGFESIAGVHL